MRALYDHSSHRLVVIEQGSNITRTCIVVNFTEEFSMSAYVIFIREETKDESQMQAYAQKAPAARIGHDITRVAFYGQLEVLEGPSAEGVAILRFPDMAAAREWYESPAYQEARSHRLKGAGYRMLLVEGSDVLPA